MKRNETMDSKNTMENYFVTKRHRTLPADSVAGKKGVVRTLSDASPKPRPLSEVQKLWEMAKGKTPDSGKEMNVVVKAQEVERPVDESIKEEWNNSESESDAMDSDVEVGTETDAETYHLATPQDQQVVLDSLLVVVQDLSGSQKSLRKVTQRFRELQIARSHLCKSLAEATNRLCKLGAPFPRELEAEHIKLTTVSLPALLSQLREQKRLQTECMLKVHELKVQRDQLLVASQEVARDIHMGQSSNLFTAQQGLTEPATTSFPTWGALFEQNLQPFHMQPSWEKEEQHVSKRMAMEAGAVDLVHTSLIDFVSNVVQRLAMQKHDGGMVTPKDIDRVLNSPGFPKYV